MITGKKHAGKPGMLVIIIFIHCNLGKLLGVLAYICDQACKK